MITPEKARIRAVLSVLLLFVGTFAISILGGNYNYISFQTGMVFFWILFGTFIINLIIYLIVTDTANRTEIIIGLVLSSMYLIVRRYFHN